MIRDIEARRINLVITKDYSRLGRNHIETSKLTEEYFPRKGVRYIALNDGIDTEQENEIMPFKGLLNEMYSKDVSKKVHSSYVLQANKGFYTGVVPPFGYLKDPEQKGHLIIDPETAPIIRRIYDLALDGNGAMKIAKTLMDERIPITRARTGTEMDANYYSWGSGRIIFSKPVSVPEFEACHSQGKERSSIAQLSTKTLQNCRTIGVLLHHPIFRFVFQQHKNTPDFQEYGVFFCSSNRSNSPSGRRESNPFAGVAPELPLERLEVVGIVPEPAFHAGVGHRCAAPEQVPGDGEALFHDVSVDTHAGVSLELTAQIILAHVELL
jgi:hypothetical protein